MQLKIFTGKEFISKGAKYSYIPLMYPFWGECDSVQGHIDMGRFDDFTKYGHKYFSLVSIEEADVVVLPSEWPEGGHYPEAEALFEMARNYKKKVVVFFNNDSSEPIQIENAVIFRTSFYAAKKKENEFALPGWNIDFINYFLDGKLIPRPKKDRPTVSYCGYVDYYKVFNMNFVYNILRSIRHGKETNPGRPLRGKAIRTLHKSKLVNTNFIIRTGTLNYYVAEAEILRSEYVKNMLDSDYALVVRGKGNFSYRLYEVLSCGRIPVFVDTNCVLPFDHIIDWKKYMIWVDVGEIDRIDEKIATFHATFTEESFKELQINIRKLYEEWIAPTGFYSNIWRCSGLPQG